MKTIALLLLSAVVCLDLSGANKLARPGEKPTMAMRSKPRMRIVKTYSEAKLQSQLSDIRSKADEKRRDAERLSRRVDEQNLEIMRLQSTIANQELNHFIGTFMTPHRQQYAQSSKAADAAAAEERKLKQEAERIKRNLDNLEKKSFQSFRSRASKAH